MVTAPARARSLDPYLCWAGLTNGRYLARGGAGPWRLACRLLGEPTALDPRIPGLRWVPRAGSGLGLRSAELDPSHAMAIAALATRADFVLAEPGLRAVGGRTVPHDFRLRRPAPPQPLGKGLVIGVVDGRCGFANAAFCAGAGGLQWRLDHFWDQAGDPGAPSWRARVPYGRELDRQAMDRLLARFIAPKALAAHGTRAAAESALYRRLGHDEPPDSDWSHGSLVLDLILREFDAVHGPPPAAPGLGVVYVQLPELALRDTSARWTASYVSDAIDYILQRAGDGAQVIVNLSLGAFAGPHDGSSMVERALDTAIARRAGRLAVVVAAGNAARVVDDATGETRLCNRQGRVAASGKVKLVVHLDAEDRTDTFVEVWMAAGTADTRVTVTLEAPGREPIAAAPGERAVLRSEPAGEVLAAVINGSGPLVAPNGARRVVLVAIGHTSRAHLPSAPLGRWVVTVHNGSAQPVDFDAWIERRDMPGELAGERPQYGFAPDSDGSSTASTLGSLANGRNTIVVGAVTRDPAGSRQAVMSEYSSTGQRAVDAFALGKRSGAGFLTGASKDMAGTSIAAAVVTGTLAAAAWNPPRAASSPTTRQAQASLPSDWALRWLRSKAGAPSLPGQRGVVLPAPPADGADDGPP